MPPLMSKSVAKKAFEGALIRQHPELRASGAVFTDEHAGAINSVIAYYDDFCHLILSTLEEWAFTKLYFQPLIEVRLLQNAILASGFIGGLLSDHNPTEERLKRIHHKVKNLSSMSGEINLPEDIEAGEESDEVFLDIWNELFVMDLLLHNSRLAFSDLEKVIRRKDLSKVDLLAKRDSQEYAIEITRIRRRDFIGGTLPGMYEKAFNIPDNKSSLQNAMRNKLNSKNQQLKKFCASEGRTYDKKVVIIKTSQEEYQDGSEVVRQEAEALLHTHRYSYIDEILLVYDTENFDWIT